MTNRRRALVTGASGGIGAATAIMLAERGYEVLGTYRSQDATRLVDAASSMSGSIQLTHLDVTNAGSVTSLFERLRSEDLLPDIVVCNAGAPVEGLAMSLSDEAIVGALELNVIGSFRVARAGMRKMVRQRWGRIVFVSSVVADMGGPGLAAYAASKSALTGLSRSMVREVAARNVTVNIVSPGPTSTPLITSQPAETVSFLERTIPAGRIGAPEEVAAAIAFLVSDSASFVNGAVLPVDGGFGMGR